MTETAAARDAGGVTADGTEPRGTSGVARLLAAAFVFTCISFVIYSLHQPLAVIEWASHDDAWFAETAQSILNGRWMGAYDHMTLIKGPAFSYFLALNHLAGTPVTLTLALAFVTATAYLCWVLWRIAGLPQVVTFVLFVLLLLQPALVPTRAIRDAIYHPLFLMMLAGCLAIALDRRPGVRWRHVVAAGLSLGFLWITREEGIWVVPALLLLALVGWRIRRTSGSGRSWLVASASVLVVAALPTLLTSAVNGMVYGTFAVVDFTGGPFQSALKQLDSISAGPEISHVPVSRAALDAVYQVSPASLDVKPYFDGEDVRGLRRTCEAYVDACGEVAGGWFAWALRDAAAQAGHYSSATESDRYWNRLSAEIRKACDNGSLRCRSNAIPLLPASTGEVVWSMPDAIIRAARVTMYQSDTPSPPTRQSYGTPQQLDRTSQLLGRPLLTRTAEAGFRSADSGWVRLKVRMQRIYAVISPLVFILGTFGFCVALALKGKGHDVRGALLVVAAVSWVLYACRVVLVALVDVSSFPAINSLYLQTAYLALYVAAFASVGAVLPSVLPRLTASRSSLIDARGVPSR
jgi:hypothetical protein